MEWFENVVASVADVCTCDCDTDMPIGCDDDSSEGWGTDES